MKPDETLEYVITTTKLIQNRKGLTKITNISNKLVDNSKNSQVLWKKALFQDAENFEKYIPEITELS